MNNIGQRLKTFEVESLFLWAFVVALVRRMTAATAAVTLACLLTEWLCYVLGRLHSSYVLESVCRE